MRVLQLHHRIRHLVLELVHEVDERRLGRGRHLASSLRILGVPRRRALRTLLPTGRELSGRFLPLALVERRRANHDHLGVGQRRRQRLQDRSHVRPVLSQRHVRGLTLGDAVVGANEEGDCAHVLPAKRAEDCGQVRAQHRAVVAAVAAVDHVGGRAPSVVSGEERQPAGPVLDPRVVRLGAAQELGGHRLDNDAQARLVLR